MTAEQPDPTSTNRSAIDGDRTADRDYTAPAGDDEDEDEEAMAWGVYGEEDEERQGGMLSASASRGRWYLADICLVVVARRSSQVTDRWRATVCGAKVLQVFRRSLTECYLAWIPGNGDGGGLGQDSYPFDTVS